MLLSAACGGDEEPEMTIEERLAQVEGRTLTAAEVDQRLDLGQTLCKMDAVVLGAVWQRLDDDQLDFQDVIFGYLCPDRSVLYAAQTGRVVTEAAEDVDVTSTSTTTAPDATSSTTRQPVTTPPTTTGGGGTTGSATSIGSETIAPEPSSTVTSGAPTNTQTSSVETSGPTTSSAPATTTPATTVEPPTTASGPDSGAAVGQGG